MHPQGTARGSDLAAASEITSKNKRPQPDWPTIHRELRRPGVTLQLIWEEHRAQHPAGYGYSRFCDISIGLGRSAYPRPRQTHVAGERMFVDLPARRWK
jgi:transposase